MSILRRQDDDVDDQRNEYGYPKQAARYRDPFAICIAAFGVLVQVGGFLWFGGQLVQRVNHAEKSIENLQTESATNAKQDSQIAVLTSQLVSMQITLQSIDRKLEQK